MAAIVPGDRRAVRRRTTRMPGAGALDPSRAPAYPPPPTMTRVRITEVTRAELDPMRLWGGNLDHPRPGDAQDGYDLVVNGWVLHRIAAPTIEWRCGERLLASLPADRPRPDVGGCHPGVPGSSACGFSTILRTLDLPAEFELQADVLAPGCGRQPLARVRGSRKPLPSLTGGPAPLPVTALGRTGTSWLMLLLRAHPQVLVAPPFPYEMRLGPYWAAVFDALSRPESYLQQVASQQRGHWWWLGDANHPVETWLEQGLGARHVGGEAVEALAGFCGERIAGFYAALAAAEDRPGARFFAEKHLPGSPSRHLLGELFPGLRELVLVRDLRDMVCSVLAFNARRGYAAFQRELFASDEEFIRSLRDPALALRDAARSGAHLLRYEDLLGDPQATLQRAFAALGLEADEARVREVLARASDVEPDQQARHRTSPAGASIGRWRRDLPEALARCCAESLGDVLREFGYEV